MLRTLGRTDWVLRAFFHCSSLQRRNRKKFVKKDCLLIGDWHQQSKGFVIGRAESYLFVRSGCRRPLPVPVRKLPVRPQGSINFRDLSRSGQRIQVITKSQPSSAVVSAAVTPTGALLPCGIRTNHDNFTKETGNTLFISNSKKVSLQQRFFGFELS